MTNWREGKDNLYGEMVRAKSRRVRHSQWGARDTGGNEISEDERLPVEWWRSVEEAGSFRISRPEEDSDLAKQVITGRVRGDETVPGWVVSIEVSKDKSVRGVWKDVRRECPGARIRRSASVKRGVEVKEL